MKKYSVICDGCGREGDSTQGKKCKKLHQLRASLKVNEGWLTLNSSGEDYCPRCREPEARAVDALKKGLWNAPPVKRKGGLIVPHAVGFSRIWEAIEGVKERLDKLERVR